MNARPHLKDKFGRKTSSVCRSSYVLETWSCLTFKQRDRLAILWGDADVSPSPQREFWSREQAEMEFERCKTLVGGKWCLIERTYELAAMDVIGGGR